MILSKKFISIFKKSGIGRLKYLSAIYKVKIIPKIYDRLMKKSDIKNKITNGWNARS